MKARLPDEYRSSMSDMIKKAQNMQNEISDMQCELDKKEYDISVGGGMVSVKIKGNMEILNITINPEIVDADDIETLSDLLVAGVNEAVNKVKSTNEGELGKITGQISMPGLGM